MREDPFFTLRELLSHNSGIEGFTDEQKKILKDLDTLKEAIDRFETFLSVRERRILLGLGMYKCIRAMDFSHENTIANMSLTILAKTRLRKPKEEIDIEIRDAEKLYEELKTKMGNQNDTEPK